MKTDNLDSGHVDNIPDIPRLSTNEKAGLRGVAAESGRMQDTQILSKKFMILNQYVITVVSGSP